jgi:hypothetical protein
LNPPALPLCPTLDLLILDTQTVFNTTFPHPVSLLVTPSPTGWLLHWLLTLLCSLPPLISSLTAVNSIWCVVAQVNAENVRQLFEVVPERGVFNESFTFLDVGDFLVVHGGGTDLGNGNIWGRCHLLLVRCFGFETW